MQERTRWSAQASTSTHKAKPKATCLRRLQEPLKCLLDDVESHEDEAHAVGKARQQLEAPEAKGVAVAGLPPRHQHSIKAHLSA